MFGISHDARNLHLIIERRRIRFPSVRLAAVLGGLGCLAFVGAGLALAASGDFDRRFSGNGIAKTGFGPGGRGFGFAWAVAVQPNDRIVIAGYTGQSADFGLARFRLNGKLDRSFGNGGTVRIDFGGIETAHDVAVQDDGRIVVVGEAPVGDRTVIGLARLTPSGDLDPSFGTGGKKIVDPFEPCADTWRQLTLALEPNGDILVGGTESACEDVNNPGFVARLEPNGDLDPSFADGGVKRMRLALGTGVSTYVNQLIVDSRGRIAAAVTTFDPSADLSARAVMVRLRSNGDYDPSFSGNGRKVLLSRDSALLSLAAAPQGRLVGTGRVRQKMLVTRVKGSGAFDRSFTGDGVKTTRLDMHGAGHVVADRVMLQRNGKPLIAAEFETGTKSGNVVVRFRPNGDFDHSFSGDGKKILHYHAAFTDTTMQANGKILLTGVAGRSSSKAFVARLKNHGRPFVTP
jgi:uncharacterized delta-60 repeat protein